MNLFIAFTILILIFSFVYWFLGMDPDMELETHELEEPSLYH